MKIKELRSLSSEELVQKKKIFKKAIFDLNCQRRMGNVEKSASFQTSKKAVAQMMTILKERELENERNNQSS